MHKISSTHNDARLYLLNLPKYFEFVCVYVERAVRQPQPRSTYVSHVLCIKMYSGINTFKCINKINTVSSTPVARHFTASFVLLQYWPLQHMMLANMICLHRYSEHLLPSLPFTLRRFNMIVIDIKCVRVCVCDIHRLYVCNMYEVKIAYKQFGAYIL